MSTQAEFLNEHKEVLDFLMSDITGQLKDARAWSAFGMVWKDLVIQPWFSEYISDRMLELAKVSDLLVKQKISDFMIYTIHPQLFALGLSEYLNKKLGVIIAPEGNILN